MEREILYKYAQDADGEVVHIGKAEPRVRYFCPGCKAEFVFRHGQIRQHYFAHKALSPNCTGEGYLHNTFKKLLLGYIKEHIEKNVALVVHARCTRSCPAVFAVWFEGGHPTPDHAAILNRVRHRSMSSARM